MEKSKVYFADMRVSGSDNLLKKLKRLILAAGIDTIDFKNKYAAIKIHFGEPGNLSYLRPNYSKVLVDTVAELGGKAFLTDSNTLYVGGRKNALDHLDAAYQNGFNPFVTGCHVLIADGLKGTDEALIPVKNGEYVKEAKIGRAIADADVIISFTHFKMHELTGMGGALKNIGMGAGSRAGKMEMHSNGKPGVDHALCVGCGACKRNCAHDAITLENRKATIHHEICAGCGRCIGICPFDAISAGEDDAYDMVNYKIAEYTQAVIQDKPSFHINFVVDVSPHCDCHSKNDAPVVPDVGMFASLDPVALDKACADAVNAQPVLPGSALDGVPNDGDHFKAAHPETNWISCLEHAQKMGMGSLDYELISIR